jgi:hypothetical protein
MVRRGHRVGFTMTVAAVVTGECTSIIQRGRCRRRRNSKRYICTSSLNTVVCAGDNTEEAVAASSLSRGRLTRCQRNMLGVSGGLTVSAVCIVLRERS